MRFNPDRVPALSSPYTPPRGGADGVFAAGAPPQQPARPASDFQAYRLRHSPARGDTSPGRRSYLEAYAPQPFAAPRPGLGGRALVFETPRAATPPRMRHPPPQQTYSLETEPQPPPPTLPQAELQQQQQQQQQQQRAQQPQPPLQAQAPAQHVRSPVQIQAGGAVPIQVLGFPALIGHPRPLFYGAPHALPAPAPLPTHPPAMMPPSPLPPPSLSARARSLSPVRGDLSPRVYGESAYVQRRNRFERFVDEQHAAPQWGAPGGPVLGPRTQSMSPPRWGADPYRRSLSPYRRRSAGETVLLDARGEQEWIKDRSLVYPYQGRSATPPPRASSPRHHGAPSSPRVASPRQHYHPQQRAASPGRHHSPRAASPDTYQQRAASPGRYPSHAWGAAPYGHPHGHPHYQHHPHHSYHHPAHQHHPHHAHPPVHHPHGHDDRYQYRDPRQQRQGLSVTDRLASASHDREFRRGAPGGSSRLSSPRAPPAAPTPPAPAPAPAPIPPAAPSPVPVRVSTPVAANNQVGNRAPESYAVRGGRQKRALLVGCGYPQAGTHALAGPEHDLKAMNGALIGKYGFHRADVKQLIDDNRVSAVRPTGRNVLLALLHLIQETKDGDVLVFYFSGYASQIPAAGGSTEECLVPADMDLVTLSELRAVLQLVPAGVHLTVITDCCRTDSLLGASALPVLQIEPMQSFCHGLVKAKSKPTGSRIRFLDMETCASIMMQETQVAFDPSNIAQVLAPKLAHLHGVGDLFPVPAAAFSCAATIVALTAAQPSEYCIESFGGAGDFIGAFTQALSQALDKGPASCEALVEDTRKRLKNKRVQQTPGIEICGGASGASPVFGGV